MVNSAIYLGGFVGVLLSGGFVYWEIGKFAAPQVPRSLFDERKEMIAYTAGLFVGVPLALVFLLFLTSMTAGFVLDGAVESLVLVAGGELAQWMLVRSVYFGSTEASPFYALGFRAGVGGILILATVAGYFGAGLLTPIGVGLVLVQSVALLQIEIAGSLLSLRATRESHRVGGGPLSGALVSVIAFYFLGLGAFLGAVEGLVAAAIVAAGMGWVFVRLRGPILSRVRAPSAVSDEDAKPSEPSFGRIDR
ncbi:MAG: hypothetical protein ACREDK_00635 [Thermoplasmata archaeon]